MPAVCLPRRPVLISLHELSNGLEGKEVNVSGWMGKRGPQAMKRSTDLTEESQTHIRYRSLMASTVSEGILII